MYLRRHRQAGGSALWGIPGFLCAVSVGAGVGAVGFAHCGRHQPGGLSGGGPAPILPGTADGPHQPVGNQRGPGCGFVLPGENRGGAGQNRKGAPTAPCIQLTIVLHKKPASWLSQAMGGGLKFCCQGIQEDTREGSWPWEMVAACCKSRIFLRRTVSSRKRL